MQTIKKIEIVMDKDGKTKDFTIKELTLKQLIDLSQTNSLLGGETGKKETEAPVPGFSFINGLLAFRPDVEKIISYTCDFKFDDILELAPSDINLLYKGFQEVNQTFLDALEKLGVLTVLKAIVKDFTKAFSK